jgi:hypothetical protein
MEERKSMNRTKLILGALSIVVGALMHAAEAKADGFQMACTLSQVQLDYNERLIFWCDGVSTSFAAYGPSRGAACAAVTADTLKSWQSMLQSALLSGRKVDLAYHDNTECLPGFTVRMIYYVRLKGL